MDSPLSPEEKQKKITQFETFINDTLKKELQFLIEERGRVYDEIAQYNEVRGTIKMLQESPTKGEKAECLMNLRNEFFIQATMPSTDYIYLDIGLGYHAEYTLSEALDVIAMLETDLNRKADEYTRKMTEVRSRIKLMLHGISQLTEEI